MDANGWVLIIGAVTVSVTTLLGAIFAGWIALKQLPAQKIATTEVHTLVNRNFSEQKDEIAALRETIAGLQDAALTKAEAREAPVIPEARS